MTISETSLTDRQYVIGSQFRFIRRNVPTVEPTLVSPLNSINIRDTDAFISRRRPIHTLGIKSEFGGRFLSEQKSRINQISDLLVRLRVRTREIQDKRNFDTGFAKSSDEALLETAARTGSVTGDYEVTITALAKSHELGSSEAAQVGRALGFSGSFRINGWNVDVTATDSLVGIRDKINQGEDTNGNGILDRAEDINGNGSIDVLSAPAVYTQEGYLPSFYYNEDLNGNNILDASEDVNNTDTADGGYSQIGVRAVVAGNQLVFVSSEPADVELRFRDPNAVLERIGFLFRHNATGEVTTEKLNKQTVEVQKADINVDGEQVVSTKNRIENAIPGVTLTLIATGSAAVSVADDPKAGVEPVANFTISYNDALRMINNSIQSGGALGKNLRLQSIHSDVVRSFYTPPDYTKGTLQSGTFKSLKEVGVGSKPSEPTAIKQIAYSQIPKQLRDRSSLPGTGKYSFLGQSKRIGINSSENFVIDLDRQKFIESLARDSTSVSELLGFAAGRLQKRLDVHLQPDYGTIRFQKEVIGHYINNQGEVDAVLAGSLDISRAAIDTGSTKNIFRSFA
ncbi:MAG: flagellar filament capping protein FliD [Nitrospinota bacterium]